MAEDKSEKKLEPDEAGQNGEETDGETIEIEDISSEAEPEDQEPEDQDTAEAEEAGGDKAEEDEPEDSGSGDASCSEEDESWAEKYTRLMADFQNFRKRTDNEKADVYSYANEKIMTDLLTVLDNFERALGSECKDEAYAEGMKMIFKQLTDILTASGLEEIDAVGQDFDPNFHHAVLTDNNPDFDSGKVTEALQKGYKLNGKVIRPTMVKVNE